MTKFLLISVLMIMGGISIGQDMHFSHFMQTGIWLSPAEAGMGEGSHRLVLGHRNQWSAISRAFASHHFSFDGHLPIGEKGTRMGYGLLVFRDQAGDVAFGTTAGELHAAISFPVTKHGQRISGGLRLAINQRSIDSDKLRFDESFDGSMFNPGIIALDQVGRSSFSFFDVGLGFAWENRKDFLRLWKAGLSIWHLNQPNQSFFSEESIALDIRYTVYLQHGFLLDRNWYMRPEGLVSLQGSYREFLIGSWLGYILNRDAFNLMTMEAGLFTRAGDALLVGFGGQWNAWRASLAYDVNYSGLRPASQWRGGYEINILYTFNRNPREIIRVPGCLIL